jgi:hypothetical protein
MNRIDLNVVADALGTALGCLDLFAAGRTPVDLIECQYEIENARDYVNGWLEVARTGTEAGSK